MATARQKLAITKVLENNGNVSKSMKQAGYSPNSAKNPKILTESEAWNKLMKKFLSDDDLAKKHQELLDATRLDHMTFPVDETSLPDNEIVQMLKGVNCKVKKIVHGEQARHVYFWSYDNKARKEALDMAYKLKGKYTEKVDVTSGGLPIQISEAIAKKNKLNETE